LKQEHGESHGPEAAEPQTPVERDLSPKKMRDSYHSVVSCATDGFDEWVDLRLIGDWAGFTAGSGSVAG
jgi:hypothetical protein